MAADLFIYLLIILSVLLLIDYFEKENYNTNHYLDKYIYKKRGLKINFFSVKYIKKYFLNHCGQDIS